MSKFDFTASPSPAGEFVLVTVTKSDHDGTATVPMTLSISETNALREILGRAMDVARERRKDAKQRRKAIRKAKADAQPEEVQP